MNAIRRSLAGLCFFAAILTACGGTPPTTGDGGSDDIFAQDGDESGFPRDVSSTDLGPPCIRNSDCSDGVFCNGVERCVPTDENADERGCIPGATACVTGETCDEAMDRCVAPGCDDPDVDRDGVPTVACGGADCDDNDATRYPGNPEVCDANGHDEDCNPCTVASSTDADVDSDGFVSAMCTNAFTGALPTCDSAIVRIDQSAMTIAGLDCAPTDPNIRPNQVETCNDTDDNCNGSVDEGVVQTFYADTDNDGFGSDAAGTTITACSVPMGFATRTGDCDDTLANRNPAAPETCDGVDNNCDESVDDGVQRLFFVDADGDGYGVATGMMRACTAPTGYTENNTDCDDTNAGRNPGAPEVCDNVDNDCDGTTNEGVSRTYYQDTDLDGYGTNDSSVAPIQQCEAPSGYAPNNIDCDDTTGSRNPAAPEVCDGLDNDCDAMVDDNVNRVFYRDADGDGYGSTDTTTVERACTPSAGFVENSIDCDDTNGARNPAAPEVCDTFDNDCDGNADDGVSIAYYPDVDRDGFGTSNPSAVPVRACSPPTGYAPSVVDCDDTAAGRNPAAPEVCDTVDNDCDGMVDEGVQRTFFRDSDQDGFGNPDTTMTRLGCVSSTGYAENNVDCDDTRAARNPAAPEVCDALDNDCDGMADDGVSISYVPDADGDGFGNPTGTRVSACSPPAGHVANTSDCDDTRSARNPSAPEVCDTLDNDCDGMTDENVRRTFYRDSDGDGFGVSTTSQTACTPPTGYVENQLDCNDGASASNPAAPEICDAIDNDCDGMIDESVTRLYHIDADGDGYGSPSGATMSACNVPMGFSANNLDCDDTNGAENPGESEFCDLIDNDCDGAIDEGVRRTFYRDSDTDGFGSPTATTMMACAAPTGYVDNNLDCADNNDRRSPAALEICDTIDNDCDTMVDEMVRRTFYTDADGDGFGSNNPTAPTQLACSPPPGFAAGNTDCDDANPDRNPGRSEVCDTVDNDCDMMVDENVQRTFYRDADSDGFGTTSPTTLSCGAPVGYAENSLDCDDTNGGRNPAAPEVCDGVDNNCNGTLDEGVNRVFYRDADGDGYGNSGMIIMGACVTMAGYSQLAGDCDDALASRSPGAAEICDGLDNNCNAALDAAGEDNDRDGFSDCTSVPVAQRDCNDNRPDVHPGALEICDEVDSDCDNLFDGPGEDDDGDRHADRNCAGAAGSDCDDTRATVYQGAPELCDALDNNCDGANGEDDDADGHAQSTSTCSGGALPKDDCNDNNPDAYPGLAETCDGADNDCDTMIDEEPASSAACDARFPNGGGLCTAGFCLLARCTGTFANCDADVSNGCESNLANSPNNCGTCGNSCGTGSACVAGECEAVLQIAAGGYHSCALRAGGRVACWGANDSGQLGTGNLIAQAVPVVVAGLTDAVEISAGGEVSCARRAGGSVVCWGNNGSGQIGNGSTTNYFTMPTPVTGISNAVQISVGGAHVCARRALGSINCWGQNVRGQLGNNTTTQSLTPVIVSGIANAVDITAGEEHSCARTATATYCWGLNASGQIGDGTTTNRLVATTVTGLVGAVEVHAGFNHSCARTATSVTCWGENGAGQLGDGTFTDRLAPGTAVMSLANAVEITAAWDFSCARRANGAVACWGAGIEGRLGNGATANSNVPVPVSGITAAVEIDGNGRHTCARTNAGFLRCWGSDISGQLGSGGITTSSSTPIPVASIESISGLSLSGRHTCARGSSGYAFCWGANDFSQLGDGTITNRPTPQIVPGLDGVVLVASGITHTCVKRASGQVLCWGRNNHGQLGDGTMVNKTAPTIVPGLTNVIELAAGVEFTCALQNTGTVVCWGVGNTGQIGNGQSSDRITPTAVSGLSAVIQIDSGAAHTCALHAAGAVFCWGAGSSGQLGTGGTGYQNSPTPVVIPARVVEIRAGEARTCARTESDDVYCWGEGLTGSGGLTAAITPVKVLFSDDPKGLSVGSMHSCMVLNTGIVRCWGENANGQIGDGTNSDRAFTVEISSPVQDWYGVAAEGNVSCGMSVTTGLNCWGDNSLGQLGNGTTIPSNVPISVNVQ